MPRVLLVMQRYSVHVVSGFMENGIVIGNIKTCSLRTLPNSCCDKSVEKNVDLQMYFI